MPSSQLFANPVSSDALSNLGSLSQVGMNGDTFSIEAPKECSKKFAVTFQGTFLTRGDVLRIFFLFSEDFGGAYKEKVSPLKLL